MASGKPLPVKKRKESKKADSSRKKPTNYSSWLERKRKRPNPASCKDRFGGKKGAPVGRKREGRWGGQRLETGKYYS